MTTGRKLPLCFGLLEASGQIVTRKLETSDDTRYLVSVENKSSFISAKNVLATISMQGGDVDGIKIDPDDRFFGTIGPRETVTKEIVIRTDRAPVGNYCLSLYLAFEAAMDREECESTPFEVVES